MLRRLIDRKQVIALILSAAFLLLQSGAQLHATEHYFHTPDELCSVYHTIQNHSPGFFSTCELSVDWKNHSYFDAEKPEQRIASRTYQPQQSRAPPVIYL